MNKRYTPYFSSIERHSRLSADFDKALRTWYINTGCKFSYFFLEDCEVATEKLVKPRRPAISMAVTTA